MNSSRRRSQLNTLLWICTALEGAVTLSITLRVRSEAGSAFLFGYSLPRLAIAGAAILGLLLCAGFAAASQLQPAAWQRASAAVRRWCASSRRLFGLFALLFTLFLSIAALLILSISPAARELVILRSWLERIGLLLVWVELAILQMGLLLYWNLRAQKDRPRLFTPLRGALLLLIATEIYAVALKIYTTATWDIRMRGIETYLYLPAAVFLLWGLLQHFFGDRSWYSRASSYLLVLSIGLVTYALYCHTAQWMEWRGTPSKAYWQLVADAFLHGRLYLIDPGTQHDLTFYNGQWYVPNPPLPALVLLPFVALFGVQNIPMILFSIVFGAIDAVVVFVLLEQAARAGLIPTSRSANLWLTGLLVFATDHWWLAIMGRMWFLSQIMTLLFAMLAALFALKRWSPWLVGASLGLAMLARPNVFTLWPLMAGIAIYLDQREHGALRTRPLLAWAVQSAVPVCLAVAGLLYYNYIRFDNFLDFGYVTINSADYIMDAVRTYGMFNLHFVPMNFNMMFLKLPVISLTRSCLYFFPSWEGYSLVAMTPAVVYVFRRFKFNAWTLGAWISILLSVGMLLFYSNNGSMQMGYRYLMDFILPLLLLLAVSVGGKPSWLFKLLVLAGVLMNAASILWYFQKWSC
jgi:hypothetical protein